MPLPASIGSTGDPIAIFFYTQPTRNLDGARASLLGNARLNCERATAGSYEELSRRPHSLHCDECDGMLSPS